RLTDGQVRLAEMVFPRLDQDDDILTAVDNWLKNGRPAPEKDCPRLDDAVAEFLKDVEASSRRFQTKRGLKTRVPLFANSIGNPKLDAITIDTVEKFLDGRKVAPRTKINDRSAVSTFFKFCIARPRQWLRHNPVRDSNVAQPEDKPIGVLSLKQCVAILKEAQ